MKRNHPGVKDRAAVPPAIPPGQLVLVKDDGRIEPTWEAVFNVYEPHVRARRRDVAKVVGAARADEVLQAAIMRLHAKWKRDASSYAAIADPTRYARKVVRSAIADSFYRRRIDLSSVSTSAMSQAEHLAALEDVRPDFNPGAELEAEEDEQERQAFDREGVRVVEAALSHLRPRLRQVVWLRHVEKLDFRDIAARLGINVDAAEKRAMRGLERLKEVLEKQEKDFLLARKRRYGRGLGPEVRGPPDKKAGAAKKAGTAKGAGTSTATEIGERNDKTE